MKKYLYFYLIKGLLYHINDNKLISISEIKNDNLNKHIIFSFDIQSQLQYNDFEILKNSNIKIYDWWLLQYNIDMNCIYDHDNKLFYKDEWLFNYLKYQYKRYIGYYGKHNDLWYYNVPKNFLITVKQQCTTWSKNIFDVFKTLSILEQQRYNKFILPTFKSVCKLNTGKLNINGKIVRPWYKFGYSKVGRLTSKKNDQYNVLSLEKSLKSQISKYRYDIPSCIFQLPYYDIYNDFSIVSIYSLLENNNPYLKNNKIEKNVLIPFLLGYETTENQKLLESVKNNLLWKNLQEYKSRILNNVKIDNVMNINFIKLFPEYYSCKLSLSNIEPAKNDNQIFQMYVMLLSNLLSFYIFNKYIDDIVYFCHDEYFFDKYIEIRLDRLFN